MLYSGPDRLVDGPWSPPQTSRRRSSIKMQSPRTSTRSETGFHKEAVALRRADPIRFLRAVEGEPRGFWGRQDRWVAWAGAFARIEVFGQPAGSRFEEVRSEARRILRRLYVEWRALPFRERPRFYGGFSFLDTAGSDPVWTGFPSASFILPRLLLEARSGDVRLRIAGVAAGGVRGSDPETDALADRVLGALRSAREPGGDDSRASAPGEGGSGGAPAPTIEDGEARERWRAAVASVLEAVEEHKVRKAVLARILDADFGRPVDPLESLRFMRAENPRAHVYMIEPHPGRTFLGAAPEILAELRRGRFRATAVAGSMRRGTTDAEDQELAQRLLESEKDRAEHTLTVEEMTEGLAPRLIDMEVEKDPRVLALSRIQHLETVITGTAGEGEDILSLVEGLHPTPAVCGSPRAEALSLIRAAEAFDRGWYAGPVGWFDLAGEGDFVPGLRAAVGEGRHWRLFAGAGIVAGSDPDAEWAEIALKFEPALRALRAGAGESPDGS